MTEILAQVEQALAQEELQPGARALLLLYLCQLWSLVNPDKAKGYWENLYAVAGHLDSDSRDIYKGVQDLLEPQTQKTQKTQKLSGMAAAVVSDIQAATEEAGDNAEILKESLRGAEARLRQRWWWPFGLAPAWTALMEAWVPVDRQKALEFLRKVPQMQQRSFLQGLNRASELSPEEWRAAANVINSSTLMQLVDELIDAEKSFRLPPAVAESLVQNLKKSILAPWGEGEVEEKRKAALNRFDYLLGQVYNASPQMAQTILEGMIREAQAPNYMAGDFSQSFSVLRRMINRWAGFPELRKPGLQSLRKYSLSYLASFLLAQWHGMIAQSFDEAESHLQDLLEDEKVIHKTMAEAWFLVTLVRRGYGAEALKLAKASANQADLVPRVKRAWVCEHPETALEGLNREDFRDDLVGRFLFGTTKDRVAFLQQETEQGRRGLPQNLWSPPKVLDLWKILEHKDFSSLSLSTQSLYKKDTPKDNQFENYLRMNGYGYYSYGDVDNYLLGAFVAWREDNIDTVDSVLGFMRKSINCDNSNLHLDVLRNIIFERSKKVLAASPDVLIEFLDWFKKTFVSQPFTYVTGTTQYTLSFKSTAPFLYAMQAAEEVRRYSRDTCQEIIRLAVAKYETNQELLRFAGALYARDQGLAALSPPPMLASSQSYLNDWQVGAVREIKRPLIAAILQGKE